jgi:signal peptidase I
VWPILAQEAPSGGWTDVIDNLARTPLSKVIIFVAICSAIRLALAPLLARVAPHKRAGAYTFARVVNEAMDAIVYAGVFVFLLIRPFCIQAFKIPSGSMLDTLQINDFIVANKAIYRYSDPHVGDIVVFRPPLRATQPDQRDEDGEVKVDFIKRCVGVAGDVIEIKSGVLYRNNQPQTEPFIKERPQFDFKLVNYNGQYWPLTISGSAVNSTRDHFPTAPDYGVEDYKKMEYLRELPASPIPKGYFLMMGDNRNNSFDSRGWGLVPKEDIIGRSEFIWMPFNRWRRTR